MEIWKSKRLRNCREYPVLRHCTVDGHWRALERSAISKSLALVGERPLSQKRVERPPPTPSMVSFLGIREAAQTLICPSKVPFVKEIGNTKRYHLHFITVHGKSRPFSRFVMKKVR